MATRKKQTSEAAVREIRRKTRRIQPNIAYPMCNPVHCIEYPDG
jgi:hypothetical protein